MPKDNIQELMHKLHWFYDPFSSQYMKHTTVIILFPGLSERVTRNYSNFRLRKSTPNFPLIATCSIPRSIFGSMWLTDTVVIWLKFIVFIWLYCKQYRIGVNTFRYIFFLICYDLQMNNVATIVVKSVPAFDPIKLIKVKAHNFDEYSYLKKSKPAKHYVPCSCPDKTSRLSWTAKVKHQNHSQWKPFAQGNSVTCKVALHINSLVSWIRKLLKMWKVK